MRVRLLVDHSHYAPLTSTLRLTRRRTVSVNVSASDSIFLLPTHPHPSFIYSWYQRQLVEGDRLLGGYR